MLLQQRDQDGNPPTRPALRDQLVALLVGGHDSSAATLAWAFERLARHPPFCERLREDEPAYLDAVVKEVLRERPALTISPRRLLEPARIAGRTIPGGVQVAAVCGWRCAELTCGSTRARFARSVGSKSRARTRPRGSRSAAACGAAPEHHSPRCRSERSCAQPHASRSVRLGARASVRGAACWSSFPTAALSSRSDSAQPAPPPARRRRGRWRSA